MATISQTVTNRQKLAWYLGHSDHREWDRFSIQEQDRMVEDDLVAGRNVSLILGSLIATGLVLCVITVLVVVATL